MFKFAVSALLLAVLVGSAGCGGSDSNGTPAATGDSAGQDGATLQKAEVVELGHTFFSPSELTISAGDTVTFRNLETMSHPLVNEDLGLDTGAFTKGERDITFDTPGTFTIINTAHGTTITVVVQAGES